MKNAMDYKGLRIEWLNHHAGFLITAKTGRKIFIDPWELKGGHSADIILVTHPHYDHFSPDDIRKLRTSSTIVIAPAECNEQLGRTFKPCRAGSKFHEDGIIIEAVPAYNTNKFRAPGEPFHPKERQWCGYIVDIDGVQIYHAGDTDHIPEMNEFPELDIALVPCGGTYTMTAVEAAEACNAMKPKIAVPMHWGKIVGSRKDADAFARAFSGETRILE